MVALTRIDENLGQPPVIEISWGEPGPKESDFPFQGVISSLNQSFTLFSSEGTPLRANLTVSLTEFRLKESAVTITDASAALRVVKAGDRLEALAATHLNDPAQWRSLAQANNIDDPRRLPVGLRLTIPGR
jgi:nucleoid-associated protein YgaU